MPRRLSVLVVAVALLAACGGGQSPPRSGAPPAAAQGAVTVFAAASLTQAFTEAKANVEAANPDVTVNLNFAGSETLARQIVQGAPADVFASASNRAMELVTAPGLTAAPPRPFAGNQLAVAVELNNPRRVAGLADLSRPDVKVVLAAPEVPVGQYAAESLRKARVAVRPVSLETDVTGVVSKIALGEADAGVVYVSDIVAGGGEIQRVDIPPQFNVPVSYPIAVLRDAPNPEAAQVFASYVVAPEGQAVLAKYGFSPAP